jgi:hypothetical protein
MGYYAVVFRGAIVTVLCVCGGCALYNPYISVGQEYGVCSDAASNSGLKQACELQKKISSARAQQVVTQNSIATGLIPLAAIVGFRTAQDLSTTATAELATAALAGYGLSQFLIQPSRLVVYDRGFSAISCALGLYAEENGRTIARNAEYGRFLAALQVFKRELKSKREELAMIPLQPEEKRVSSRALADLENRADTMAEDIQIRFSANLDGYLAAAAQRIESEINTSITSTALALTALNPQIQTILRAPPVESKNTAPSDAMKSFFGMPKAAPDKLTSAFELLKQAYDETLEAAGTAPATAADFSKCTVGVVQAQAAPPEQPLMLGNGNVEQGTTKELNEAESLRVQLFGGRPPFDVKLLPGDGKVSAMILQSSSVYMVIVEKKGAAKGAAYTVIVTDAAGALREFKVVSK